MAEATAEMLRFGIGLRYPMIVMNSGPATLSWGPPRWTTRGEAPRVLQRGDLMQAELMPMCGNQEVQVQMTVAWIRSTRPILNASASRANAMTPASRR